MFTDIAVIPMFVFDQDVARDYYVDTLGLEVAEDVDLGMMRWLTVRVPGSPLRILLQRPGPPAIDQQTADQARELTAKGATTWVIFSTDDCQATFAELTRRGAEIVQKPMRQEYGIDMAIRDPFGNQIRITQPPPSPDLGRGVPQSDPAQNSEPDADPHQDPPC